MTEDQKQALEQLRAAIDRATDTGLFDELAADVHPDTINAFCDALTESK